MPCSYFHPLQLSRMESPLLMYLTQKTNHSLPSYSHQVVWYLTNRDRPQSCLILSSLSLHCCCSVSKPCLILCDPMDPKGDTSLHRQVINMWSIPLQWSAFQVYPKGIFYIPPLLVAQMVKNLPTMQETWVRSLGQEDPLEKGMATQSSIFVWRIPGTEEPGGL